MIKTLEKLSKDELITEVVKQNSEIENLKHQIDLLRKLIFSSKKETHKAIEHPQQTELEFAEKVDLDLPQDEELQQVSYKRRKPLKKRTDYSKLELPADLPREEVVIEPADKTDDMVKVSQEETELLAIRPQQFFVKKIIRPVYVKVTKNETGNELNRTIITAELPARIIAGGKVDESFLVALLLDKYVDHLPLYRQQKKYERLGVKLCDSTIGDWIAKTINYLEVLYLRLAERIRNETYLQCDETTIRVMDKKKKGKTHLGYYWVYLAVHNKLCLFEYNPSREHVAPLTFLQNYNGVLQTDGYSAYETLAAKQNTIIPAGCMAHARRKFFDAQDNNKEKATWMLDKMQLLYETERKAREEKLTHEQRLELRKQKSVPIIVEIKKWLDEQIITVTPKSPIGQAMAYTKSRWEKLIAFTSNGQIEIDNNLVENAIRPIALGRKNYLFAGSHEAAQRGAIIYSFIACCKLNGIDPYMWLEDVLRKLPETKSSELDSLLPINGYTFS